MNASAVVAPLCIELCIELQPTADFPRWLRMRELSDDYVSVAICAPKDRYHHLAVACAPRAMCWIVRSTIEPGRTTLVVDCASFDLSDLQARQLQQAFSLREDP